MIFTSKTLSVCVCVCVCVVCVGEGKSPNPLSGFVTELLQRETNIKIILLAVQNMEEVTDATLVSH